MEKDGFTTKETAQLLDCTASWVIRLLQRGVLTGQVEVIEQFPFKQWLISPASVEKFQQRQLPKLHNLPKLKPPKLKSPKPPKPSSEPSTSLRTLGRSVLTLNTEGLLSSEETLGLFRKMLERK